MKYFGGIEGGATHSRLVICDESGNCVATATGLGTNHWMIGISECARRIADMVARAKEEANIPEETRLTSLGLSLSGCEQEATNIELEEEIRLTHSETAENYVVCSDTIGSVFTASPVGGLVIISGTGSNALLRNPDGSIYTCGGWGNFLGDEGSAWHIAYRAIKTVYDDMDNFQKSAYPTQRVWELIQQHFNVKTRYDLLPHCHAKFDKPFFASLCRKLALAATEEGDELCQHLFKEAGRYIARSIQALLPKVHSDLIVDGDLPIVCVGSVWLSWSLMREGFIKQLNQAPVPTHNLKLINITKSMAYGACYLAADSINFNLPRNYADNCKVLFHYQAGVKALNGAGSILSSNGQLQINGVCNGNLDR